MRDIQHERMASLSLASAPLSSVASVSAVQLGTPNAWLLVRPRWQVYGVSSGFLSKTRSSRGEVCLVGAHIGAQLDCTGGQFSNPDGDTLNAFGLTVDGSMYCSEGFSATGRVNRSVPISVGCSTAGGANSPHLVVRPSDSVPPR